MRYRRQLAAIIKQHPHCLHSRALPVKLGNFDSAPRTSCFHLLLEKKTSWTLVLSRVSCLHSGTFYCIRCKNLRLTKLLVACIATRGASTLVGSRTRRFPPLSSILVFVTRFALCVPHGKMTDFRPLGFSCTCVCRYRRAGVANVKLPNIRCYSVICDFAAFLDCQNRRTSVICSRC